MKRDDLKLSLFLLFIIMFFGAEAQKQVSGKTQKKKTEVRKTSHVKTAVTKAPAVQPTIDLAADEKKVRDIVSILEYMLNALGSSTTSARDKEVLVTEGFAKIFKDPKVQIEDDLVGDRLVITNKDVGAYLKDVDFFFTDAKFELTIDGITNGTNEDSKHFYKVALTRNLAGTTMDGQVINTTLPRFIEINYDPTIQDLKIVSIYTTEFSGKDALSAWWNQLSFEWQGIFKATLGMPDSVAQADLKKITALEELNVSHNAYITTLEPLSFLKNLKSLNLSQTNIRELISLRNLTDLTELNLSYTAIQDLSPLKYSSNLLRMNASHTGVADISVLEKMPKLQSLDLSSTTLIDLMPLRASAELTFLSVAGTQVSNLSPLEGLTQLKELNLSSTPIRELNPLKGLKNLVTLDIDSTQMSVLEPLNHLDNLKVLLANYTPVSDLRPLQKLSSIERIYVDQSGVGKAEADLFKAANPKVLVVYDSRDLQLWWDGLTVEWKGILSKAAHTGIAPSKEELAKVTHLDSINITNSPIHDLEPLRKFLDLEVVIARQTDIRDLSPLRDHKQIRYCDISDTDVNDLLALGRFTKLEVLRADRSKVGSIEPLGRLASLKTLYVDQTAIKDVDVRALLLKNPGCLVVHKTAQLRQWWNLISPQWKEVFRTQMAPDTTSTPEHLHRLAERESLQFRDVPVTDLSALSEFVRLKELHFSGTGITDLSMPYNVRSLKSLHATNSPLQMIEALLGMNDLEDLDISNTPIDNLEIVGRLPKLKTLNCAGTQIKKLDPLENISNLEFLDCSNTRANSLDHLVDLPLKTLKCFNSKLSAREIEAFKKRKPDCNVIYYR